MTRHVMKLSTDYKVSILDLDTPEGSLHVLQSAVGGYLERVALEGFDMYLDEDGKGKKDALTNFAATEFFVRKYGMNDIIVGDVVFTGEVDEEGEITALPKEIRQRLLGELMFD